MRIDNTDVKIYKALYGGPKRRKDLLAVVNSPKILDRRLEKAARYGYIHSPKWGVYELTKEGRELVERSFLASVVPHLDHPKLKKIIEIFPFEHYRSFFRILLDIIVGKAHLLDHFDKGWPTLMAFGPTKTLKTTIGEVICYILGLDPNKNIYIVPFAAPKELGVRHQKVKGGFQAIPSLYFDEPFVVFDECDKLPVEVVKRSPLLFIADRREFQVENKMVRKKCCVLLTFNMKGGLNGLKQFGIEESLIRRTIPFDTSFLEPRLENPARIARRLLQYVSPRNGPRLNIHDLRPELTKLPNGKYSLLEKLIFSCVRREHQKLVDLHSLEILSLCRIMLLKPDTSVDQAIFSAIWDVLTCFETNHITEDDWRDRFKRIKEEYVAPLEGEEKVTKELQDVSLVKSHALVPSHPLASGEGQAEVQESSIIERLRFRSSKQEFRQSVEALNVQLNEFKPYSRTVERIAEDISSLLEEIEKAATQIGVENLKEYYYKEVYPLALQAVKDGPFKKKQKLMAEALGRQEAELKEFLEKEGAFPRRNLEAVLQRLGCGIAGSTIFKGVDNAFYVFHGPLFGAEVSEYEYEYNKDEARPLIKERLKMIEFLKEGILNLKTTNLGELRDVEEFERAIREKGILEVREFFGKRLGITQNVPAEQLPVPDQTSLRSIIEELPEPLVEVLGYGVIGWAIYKLIEKSQQREKQ